MHPVLSCEHAFYALAVEGEEAGEEGVFESRAAILGAGIFFTCVWLLGGGFGGAAVVWERLDGGW